jgi:glycosyltransferase involved in cell wall biosynthesis
MARELRRRVSEFDIVHVHSLYLFPTLAAAHYARRFRVPYLIRPHGTLDPYLRRRHRFRKFLYSLLIERRNLNRASAIHYTAQEELELARPLGIRAPGVVVPLGVNGKAFEHLPARGEFRRHYPSLNGKLLVVFLGRLTPKKGLDLLIDAFPLVLRQFRDAHLVIAGPDDEGFGPRVRQWIGKAGVENATTLVGMVEGDRKLALLADTDVWVLPSYTENFGIAAVEAMACGLPIVLSDKVNIHREVSEAQAGLITGCDPVQVAAAISQLLGDQSLRQRLGAAARELVAAKFTWDSAATSLVGLYRELVRGAVPGRVPQVETADVT